MLKSTNETVLHCYPGLVALVTAKHEGVQNIMAAGWHSYISYDPPIYGVAIAEERFTHHLVEGSKGYAINFVPAEYAHYIERSGKLTGKDGDKFREIGAEWIEGDVVSAPILKDAYVAYECEVIDINTYGDHDWIVGNIRKFHQDKSKFNESGLPDFEKLQLPLYLGRSNYLIADTTTTLKKIDMKK
ncbi:flavin reductase family protein [Bacillus shivajii]|uniref:flavin reductase family protein n=1 Tax=Bacillus shivajii TaxID=1983719 RepID=UPI001CFAA020|nr:flavin reductase family protein [Bacillus shivajii]UCZ53658.1 flavin reductase family protein [Bacillus shivajii]